MPLFYNQQYVWTPIVRFVWVNQSDIALDASFLKLTICMDPNSMVCVSEPKWHHSWCLISKINSVYGPQQYGLCEWTKATSLLMPYFHNQQCVWTPTVVYVSEPKQHRSWCLIFTINSMYGPQHYGLCEWTKATSLLMSHFNNQQYVWTPTVQFVWVNQSDITLDASFLKSTVCMDPNSMVCVSEPKWHHSWCLISIINSMYGPQQYSLCEWTKATSLLMPHF